MHINDLQNGSNAKPYLPMIAEGKIKDTEWPIDGHTLLLTLWDYDKKGET